MTTRDRIPRHLRRYVVEHDTSAYDEIDQGVWRFVLLQMYERGIEQAHPAYVHGLAQTGISVERIPSIDEMDRCLGEFGWGAVAVDGFIPPRAFQEFQAHRILTIAAAIRRPEHLAYTPAPDIIHESAGHAPIVPDPEYRRFLQRFGEIGAGAFSSPEDERLYQAVRALSEIKECHAASSEKVAAAERVLLDAQRGVTELSEAALLARLHWWTVEYGLVGTPDCYKLYGAGLLSSLGESHFLGNPEVRKLPLSASCVDFGYDITAPQPQLFVAESFAQLSDVLEQVAERLAQRIGGQVALERALRAREVATLELDSSVQLIGVPHRVWGTTADPVYLQLEGPCAVATLGEILPGHRSDVHAQGYGTPLGPLEDGRELARMRRSELSEGIAPDGMLELRFRSGVRLRGRPTTEIEAASGLLLLSFEACTVTYGDELLFDPAWGAFDLVTGSRVTRAHAGPCDPTYWPETEYSLLRVPRAKQCTPEDTALLGLYHQALQQWKECDASSLGSEFERICGELDARYPAEWLLRWNLLECLNKVGDHGPLGDKLRRQLLEIETGNSRELPITTGLRFLDRHYGRT